jgi:hypothetical protein
VEPPETGNYSCVAVSPESVDEPSAKEGRQDSSARAHDELPDAPAMGNAGRRLRCETLVFVVVTVECQAYARFEHA